MTPKLNTLELQEGKLGRPFRCTAVIKKTYTAKWVNRVEKHHWLHVFKYIDDGTLFALEIDYTDKIIKVHKNYEIV